MMATNMIVGPLLALFPPAYLFRLWQQSRLAKRLEKGEVFEYTQKDTNEIFEPVDPGIDVKYCNVIRTFLVSAFFFELCPLAMPLCFGFMIFSYWVDKYLLIRRAKRMRRFHADLAIDLGENAELAMFLLAAGKLIFKYKATRTLDIFDFILIAITICTLIVPFQSMVEKDEDSKWEGSTYTEEEYFAPA